MCRHSDSPYGATCSFEQNNGEIIASSKGYKSKAAAENGIKSVQTNAPGATVVDKTA